MTNSAFHDNVVLLTDASSGIGRQLALQLAAAVARLEVRGRRVSELRSLPDPLELREVVVRQPGQRPAGLEAPLPAVEPGLDALPPRLRRSWAEADLIANQGLRL